MRLKALVLGSVSATAMLGAPVHAQTAPSAATDRPAEGALNATPQTSDATGTVGQGTVADQGDVVVTGLRRSLQSAQNIKRNSVQQIDAIVAEDIGKLPDVAISDTAARIPGIEVERGGGEANRVLLRGLDNNFYTTTYNGREIFTAEARSVALQDFPAGGIAALEAFKTTTADIVEGGIAGELNVRSRRPFDFNGFQIAGSLWGQYETRSHKADPNGNFLISDRWNTGIGELGALVNVSYTSLHYVDSSRVNTDFVATDGTPYRFPDIQRVEFGVGHRERPSVNGSLQWRPSPRLEFYFDGLWQGFRNAVGDRTYNFYEYPVGGSSYSNFQTQPNSNLANSFTVADPNRPDGFQGATFSTTDTFQVAGGGRYDGGPFKLTVDLARTWSTFKNSIYSLDTAYATPVTINANPAGDYFSLSGANPSDPSTYIFRGFFDRRQLSQGDDYQGRIDATYDTGVNVLNQIQAGFRYVDRHGSYQEGSRYASLESQHIPLAAVPGLTLSDFQSGFPDDDPAGVKTYVTPTYESMRNDITQLRQFVGFAAGDPPLDPTLAFFAHEKSYAGYFQLKYGLGEAGGIRIDGALGLRVVSTQLNISGTSTINGVLTPTDAQRDYWDWLPNASARVRFTDALQLRLSATQTRTRPAFTDYNPGSSIGEPGTSTTCPAGTSPCQVRGASGGDPNLNTIRSDNYDASLEYYFSRAGFASVGVFKRNLTGFVQTETEFVQDPNYGLLLVTRPFNTSTGRIRGVEGQFNSFFDFAGAPTFVRSLGVQANITYLDTNLNYPANVSNPNSNIQVSREIVGVSKWTYNVDGFYEHGGLSARLSWNWRSSFLYEPGDGVGPFREDANYFAGGVGARLFVERAQPVGRLDLSASYDLTKNVTLTADATNLLATPLRVDATTYDINYTNPAKFPRDVRYEESVYSAGVRFRF